MVLFSLFSQFGYTFLQPGYCLASKRYRCREIDSVAKAQELLRQGHTYLDGDGEACESLR